MDIAGEDGCVIMTWDGLTHWGVAGLVCSGVTGLGGRSSRGDRGGGFTGSGTFPIRSDGVALGKMTEGLVAGNRSKDTTSGVAKEG